MPETLEGNIIKSINTNPATSYKLAKEQVLEEIRLERCPPYLCSFLLLLVWSIIIFIFMQLNLTEPQSRDNIEH